MASSSTCFWAAYNAVASCCLAAKGSRGPYHRHCGCALHSLPHGIHSAAKECVSMPRNNGVFKSLSIYSAAEKKSDVICSGSPCGQLSSWCYPVASGHITNSSEENSTILSIAWIQDVVDEHEMAVQASSLTSTREYSCHGVASSRIA